MSCPTVSTSSTATIIPLTAGRGAFITLERRTLHRFLVGYVNDRGLQPSPELRALLIAAIDVYPGPFPVRRAELEAHVDAVVRVPSVQRMAAAAAGNSR
jgi:hypothetical protein